MDLKIENTLKALKANRFGAYYAETSAEALEIVKKLLKDGEKVTCGGSLTIKQVGVIDYISGENFDYTDPYAFSDPEVRAKMMEQRFTSDTFFCSANAIISDGRLYNEDGICSRVAPMLFGPKQVIVVAGKNKIVDTEAEAKHRVQTVAAPLNAKRLATKTPCVIDGVCHNCKSEARICCSTVITNFNRIFERIKVIIVNEDLGM